jgi:hypothetical protein
MVACSEGHHVARIYVFTFDFGDHPGKTLERVTAPCGDRICRTALPDHALAD